MASVPLNCETLGDLSGGFARGIINKAIDRAVADLDDRGDDEKPRKVHIELTLVKTDNGTIATHVSAWAAIPKHRTPATFAQTTRKQGREELMFQEHNPERPDQSTFTQLDEQEEKE